MIANVIMNDNFKLDKKFKQYLKQVNTLDNIKLKHKVLSEDKYDKIIFKLKDRYNSNANADDGSCIAKVLGCMDKNAENYNEKANIKYDDINFFDNDFDYAEFMEASLSKNGNIIQDISSLKTPNNTTD